jgi:hypothetical protein
VPFGEKLAAIRVDVWEPTIGDPIPHRPRINTPVQTTVLRHQVRQWLRKDVIEPIPLNAYRNNLVFVAKKTGDTRVCVDCTPVNAVTDDFEWPLPRLLDLRHNLAGAQWFSRLDLKDAFFRIKVPPNLRIYTSFRCDGMQYQFKRMPFGLKTAPATFHRFMDTHLALFALKCFWYIDDILIHARTLAELRKNESVIRKHLRTIGCEINEDKSECERESLLFCGLQIFSGGLSPNADRVRELLNIPPPTTKNQAQSALGLVSYLRDFIPLTSHFTSLLYPDKHGLRLETDAYSKEWTRLLRHVATAVTSLRHWKEGVECDVYTDASGTGLGVVLIQEGQVVALASRQLTSAEARYSATDREHLALVYVAEKFPLFLHQTKAVTRVHSDHSALLNRKSANLTPRQARWKAKTDYWIPTLLHVRGKDNPADFISRWSAEINGGAWKT